MLDAAHPQYAQLTLELLLFPPNILDERIGDTIQAVTAAHDDVRCHQFVHDGLNFLDPDLAPDRLRVICCGVVRDYTFGVTVGRGNAFNNGRGKPAELLDLGQFTAQKLIGPSAQRHPPVGFIPPSVAHL